MSENPFQHFMQSQVPSLSTTLEELIKTNQQIWNKVSQEIETGRNFKTAKEMLIYLEKLEKRDEHRGKTLAVLEEKICSLCKKVENLDLHQQTCYSAKHLRNRSVITTPPALPGRTPYRQISNCDSRILSENSVETVHKNPSPDTKKIQDVREMFESQGGSISENVERKGVLNVGSGYKLIQSGKFLKKEIKKDIIGLRFKETIRSVDNRLKTMYGEKCVPGEMINSETRYRTSLTTDKPTKNNLHTRLEVLSVKNLGLEQKLRSEFIRQQPRSKRDFKNLAGLMRDPDVVPSIRDLNTWRSIAEDEKNRGMFLEASKDEKGIDTCLVLDISESMKGQSFDEMIKMAKLYVRGIEEIAIALPDFAENIGIATFGHYIEVVQHMTNDYKKILDVLDMLSPGGSSPMSAGLYMGLACCLGNKCKGFGSPPMFSKMIMFTDGKATSDVVIQSDADDPPSNATEELIINMALDETSRDIGRRDFRVYCYAIGCESDIYLKTITENTKGKIYRGDEIQKLIRMTQIGNIAMGIKDNMPDVKSLDYSAMKDVCQALHIGLMDSNVDIDEVIHLAKFFRSKTKGGDTIDEKRYMEMSDPSLPPIGTRVRRGPDWNWGYQDSGGPGTLVGHSQGHVWVEWDSGHLNVYKYNSIVGYDVVAVQEPRTLRADELIAVGCLVQRGLDWRFNDQDGGEGNVGVVVKVDKNATVLVRWPNKHKAVYKYGNDGFFEIKICDPAKVYGSPGNMKISVWDSEKQDNEGTIKSNLSMQVRASPSENKKSETVSSLMSKVDETDKRSTRKEAVTIHVSWSYKKDENWYVYPENVNVKIEKAFQRNSQLCIVEVHGEIFQISFKKMVQICSKTGHVTQVKRTDKKEKTDTGES